MCNIHTWLGLPVAISGVDCTFYLRIYLHFFSHRRRFNWSPVPFRSVWFWALGFGPGSGSGSGSPELMVPLVCFCNATAPLPMPMQFNCLRVERISSWPSSFVCLFSAATGGFGLPWVLMFAAAGLMPMLMPPPLIVHLVCIFMKSLCGLCNKFNSSLFMCHRRDIYHSI